MNDTTFSDPKRVLDEFPVRKGEIVVDIGAGMGAYSLLIADLVGDHGSVYAAEVQLSYVDSLKKTAINEGLDNLHVIWADAELPNGTKLAGGLADVIILTNVLFTVEDKEGLVREIKRITKSGGRVLIVDWEDSFSGIGPHPSRIFSEKSARDLFISNGFDFIKKIPAGEHHYGIIVNNK